MPDTTISAIRRPRSLRRPSTTLALGLSALVAGPALAQQARPASDEVQLETLKIEDRAADVNPHAQAGAPYKARVSGDSRRPLPLAQTPATITVVTEAQIKESGRTDLRAILEAQPGVTIGTGEGGNQFGDRYIIRGQEARSDIFVDGLRDPGLQARESFAIDQLEITKGPSATFAGRGASGGSINAITKQASTGHDFYNFDISGGTQRHIRGTVDSNFRLSDSLAARVNLLYTDEEVPDREPASRRRYGGALALRADMSENVALLMDYYHLSVRDRADIGQAIANAASGGEPYRDMPSGAQDEDFQNANVNILTGRFLINAFGDFVLENAARYGRTQNSYLTSQASRFTRGIHDPAAPGAVDTRIANTRSGWQDIQYFADRLNLVGSIQTGSLKHNIVAGVEYTTNSVDGRNGNAFAFTATGPFNCISGTGTALNAWCLTNGQGQRLDNAARLLNRTGISRNMIATTQWKVDSMSGYLMDTLDLASWLTVAGGLRFDAFRYDLKSFNATTGMLASSFNHNGTLWNYNASATLKPAENSIIYVAWATGADINGGESDVGTNCGYGGLCTATDPDLGIIYKADPERSENFELGTKWDLFDNRLMLTAAAFQTIKSGLMEGGNDSYVSTGGLNSGRHRVRGVELGAVGNFTDALSGQISATFMKSRMMESLVDPASVGRRLSNFANNSIDAQLRYQFSSSFALGGNATHQSEMFAGQPDAAAAWNATTNSYNVRIPPWTTFGAFASYELTDNLALRLNLLNLANKQYYVAAYRSGGFAYLGDGRTVRLTLSGHF